MIQYQKENKLKIVLLDSPPCIQEELTDFGLHGSLLVGLHVDKDNEISELQNAVEQLKEAIHQLNLAHKAVASLSEQTAAENEDCQAFRYC